MSNLMITLNNGKLTDQSGDTGYIASNFQFQFDKVCCLPHWHFLAPLPAHRGDNT